MAGTTELTNDQSEAQEGLRRSYKFRLRPTRGQELRLNQMLADFCDLYNAALESRRGSWARDRLSVTMADQSRELPWIRANVPNQGQWSAWAQQEVLRRVDRAFQGFFRRVRAAKNPGYPRFKAKARWNTAVFHEGNGARWLADTSRLAIVGLGHIKVHRHREIRGRIKTITIKREGQRWYAVFSCDQVPAAPLPPTSRVAGVDLGLNVFAAVSDGDLIPNPRFGRRNAKRLARLQAAHAATGYNSIKRRRAIGDLYRKLARQRRDHHHKTAYRLVRDFDTIVVEDLVTSNLVRRIRPSPGASRESLPNGQAAKSGLNRSIHDAGWAQFLTILDAKAEEAGRRVIRVSPHYTSQTCSRCGDTHAENRDGEVFACQVCGYAAHADVNAATNILRRGLAPQQTVT